MDRHVANSGDVHSGGSCCNSRYNYCRRSCYDLESQRFRRASYNIKVLIIIIVFYICNNSQILVSLQVCTNAIQSSAL